MNPHEVGLYQRIELFGSRIEVIFELFDLIVFVFLGEFDVAFMYGLHVAPAAQLHYSSLVYLQVIAQRSKASSQPVDADLRQAHAFTIPVNTLVYRAVIFRAKQFIAWIRQ